MERRVVFTDDWVNHIHDSNRWKKIYEDAISKDPDRKLEETRLIQAKYNGCSDGIHTTIKIMYHNMKLRGS